MGDDLPDYQLGISILAQALASLQAEVTQLATVNVDLVAQSLSELTAVVSATALDIRALTFADKAHIGIPYDSNVITKSDVSVADGAAAILDVTSTDWGADKAWITYGFSFYAYHITIDFMSKKDDNLRLILENRTDDFCLRKRLAPPIYRSFDDGNIYILLETFFIPGGFYSSSSQTLRLGVLNNTGTTIAMVAEFMGVAIDE